MKVGEGVVTGTCLVILFLAGCSLKFVCYQAVLEAFRLVGFEIVFTVFFRETVMLVLSVDRDFNVVFGKESNEEFARPDVGLEGETAVLPNGNGEYGTVTMTVRILKTDFFTFQWSGELTADSEYRLLLPG